MVDTHRRAELRWPALRVDDWVDTRDTLHMWTRSSARSAWCTVELVNHWWQVTLYVSPRGLTTSAIPYQDGFFDIEFDFIDHRCSSAAARETPVPSRWHPNRSRSSTPNSWGAFQLASRRGSSPAPMR